MKQINKFFIKNNIKFKKTYAIIALCLIFALSFLNKEYYHIGYGIIIYLIYLKK